MSSSPTTWADVDREVERGTSLKELAPSLSDEALHDLILSGEAEGEARKADLLTISQEVLRRFASSRTNKPPGDASLPGGPARREGAREPLRDTFGFIDGLRGGERDEDPRPEA